MATGTLDPTGNANTEWAVYDYTKIDDGTRYPNSTPDDGVAIDAQDKGDSLTIQSYNLGNISSVSGGTITSVKVYARGLSVTHQITGAQASLGGNSLAYGTWTSSGSGWHWKEWTGLSIDMSSGLTSNTLGLKAPSLGNGEDASANSVYLEYTYSVSAPVDKTMSDSIGLTDAFPARDIQILETIGMADSEDQLGLVYDTDTITIVDDTSLNTLSLIADVVTLSDVVSSNLGAPYYDGVSMTEDISIELPITDTLTLVDVLVASEPKGPITDEILILEAVLIEVALTPVETVTLIDILAIQITVTLTDTITLTDVIASAYAIGFTDSFALSDVISKVEVNRESACIVQLVNDETYATFEADYTIPKITEEERPNFERCEGEAETGSIL